MAEYLLQGIDYQGVGKAKEKAGLRITNAFCRVHGVGVSGGEFRFHAGFGGVRLVGSGRVLAHLLYQDCASEMGYNVGGYSQGGVTMDACNEIWEVRVRRDCPYTHKMEFTEAELFAPSRRAAIHAVLGRIDIDDGWRMNSAIALRPFGETPSEKRDYLRRKTAEVVAMDRALLCDDSQTQS